MKVRLTIKMQDFSKNESFMHRCSKFCHQKVKFLKFAQKSKFFLSFFVKKAKEIKSSCVLLLQRNFEH